MGIIVHCPAPYSFYCAIPRLLLTSIITTIIITIIIAIIVIVIIVILIIVIIVIVAFFKGTSQAQPKVLRLCFEYLEH